MDMDDAKSFLSMQLKHSYDSLSDDILFDFYIPMLERTQRYDRISGFFSSTALAVAARGILGLIENGGTMRLLTCQRLSPEDSAAICACVKESQQQTILSHAMMQTFEATEDAFARDHVAALGWMLEHHRLDMRIAVLLDGHVHAKNSYTTVSRAILHEKIGLLYDTDYHGVSFSGSNNESAMGWLENIEEFKVFKNWVPGEHEFFRIDQNRFENLWKMGDEDGYAVGERRDGIFIKTLPQAVAEELIEAGKEFDRDRLTLRRYQAVRSQKMNVTPRKERLSLYDYQQQAVDQWCANDHALLLEMATGTGKTRTAIGCMKQAMEEVPHRLIIVIATPQTTLTRQWRDDLHHLDLPIASELACDGTQHDWKSELKKAIQRVSVGICDNLVIYTTHATASSDVFLTLLRDASARNHLFLIGDEVHGMGAPKIQRALLPEYAYRLGLSATPQRWFDEDGTTLIQTYFGNDAFRFSLHDALTKFNPRTGKTFLVNYTYHSIRVSLTEEELAAYIALTEKIIQQQRGDDPETREHVQRLLMRRAEITKNAEAKYQALAHVLDTIGPSISKTIIFVSPQQKPHVLQMLAARHIIAHQVTEEESQYESPRGGESERKKMLRQFAAGGYQVLVAMKCMDEGIDIPMARRGILLASSTNPREYVQRIGRVIRQAPGKKTAELYDFFVKPDLASVTDPAIRKLEKRIYQKEFRRIREIATEALNSAEVLIEFAKY